VLYAERDAPEIVARCTGLEEAKIPVRRIAGAFHSDIFLLEETAAAVRDTIREWYGEKT